MNRKEEMPEDQIKFMVDRFLGWKLPSDFNPDGGISFKKTFNDHLPQPTKNEPSGTNLFDATQADAMVRYMVEGLAALRTSATPEEGVIAVPPVERIEMVDYSRGYKMESEPEWRVQVSGVCADFQTETAANNFRNAILALPSDSGKAAPDAWRDFVRRCKAYLEDAPLDGRHSDAAGSNAYELIEEATNFAALAPATEDGEPPLAKLLKEVDPGLASILTDNAAYVNVIRANVIEECAKIAERAAKRCVRERVPNGNSVATFVAQQIRALSPSPSVGTGTQQEVVGQHLSWLFLYMQTINEKNWRDTRDNAIRQLEQLSLMFPGRVRAPATEDGESALP